METPAQPETLPNGVLCPKCGYDMDGLTAGVCPECGYESDLGGLDRVTTIQSNLLSRARPWNAIHIALLLASAGVFGVIRLIDPPWFPDALGPLNPFLAVVLSLVIVFIISSRRGRVRSPLMRTVLIRRLWIAHLAWITLGVGAMVNHFVGPSSTVAVQMMVICAVVISLPLALISVRDGIRSAEVGLTAKEWADLRSLVIVGWLLSNFSCISLVHSVEFL